MTATASVQSHRWDMDVCTYTGKFDPKKITRTQLGDSATLINESAGDIVYMEDYLGSKAVQKMVQANIQAIEKLKPINSALFKKEKQSQLAQAKFFGELALLHAKANESKDLSVY